GEDAAFMKWALKKIESSARGAQKMLSEPPGELISFRARVDFLAQFHGRWAFLLLLPHPSNNCMRCSVNLVPRFVARQKKAPPAGEKSKPHMIYRGEQPRALR